MSTRRRQRRREPIPGTGPVRRIRLNRRSITGHFPSLKLLDDQAERGNGNAVASYESTLERDLFRLLEFVPEVVSFSPQPLTVYYAIGRGRTLHHVPDVMAKLRDGSELLIDVKYRDEVRLKWADLHAPFLATRRYAAARGWRYQIWTEVEIRTAFLKNAEFLLGFRRREISMADVNTVLDYIAQQPGITIGQLLGSSESGDTPRPSYIGPVLWYLISKFVVTVNLQLRLNAQSELSVNEYLVHESWLSRLRQRPIVPRPPHPRS